MAVSLETRAPFLDHNIFELAWRIPLSMKINRKNNTYVGKHILRKILYKYVPEKIIDRPKAGFGVPIGKWLRGPLKEWAEDYLTPSLIKEQGYLNSKSITKLWEEHISMKCDHSQKLWNILMWQAWQDQSKFN